MDHLNGCEKADLPTTVALESGRHCATQPTATLTNIPVPYWIKLHLILSREAILFVTCQTLRKASGCSCQSKLVLFPDWEAIDLSSYLYYPKNFPP